MIITKNQETFIISNISNDFEVFIENFNSEYQNLKNNHIIVNLDGFIKIDSKNIKKLFEISKTHKKSKKSFIVVSLGANSLKKLDLLDIVPTVQEAFDIIELDEIERDLGF
ncbi:MAG: hypothetical protein RLZZ312_1706 [Bacteroidota bacterium]|jgi:anti-anti-sigma regulatory factor